VTRSFRRIRLRRLLAVLFAAVLLMVAVACSGDDGGEDSDGAPLRVDAMAAAVAALEASLGGPQTYFEVNATPTLVNLYVAGDGTATLYIYDAVPGTLGQPDAPQPASGPTFQWAAVDFDSDRVLTQALDQLPDSLPRFFSVTAVEGGSPVYQVVLESKEGGALSVVVAGDGTVEGVQAD
jgi:hypothetical protein